MFKNYEEVKKYLDTLGMFRMKAGQDRVLQALENLGLFPLPYKAVQIVGTNGKGSTSSFLASIAKENGLKTGLFTSPHFVSVKERILIDNCQVDDEDWLKNANIVYEAHKDLTYFEFISVLAVLMYKEADCDIVFFEAGLGGKFDATTAFEASMTVFTPISLDHCSILGSSIEEIARDKAQAMGDYTKKAISAKQEEEARQELEKRAEKFAIPLTFVEDKITSDIQIQLEGEHQKYNAHLALQAWEEIASLYGFENTREKTLIGLKNAFIAGRLQIISKDKSPLQRQILLDGGHNVQGLEAIKKYFSANNIALSYIVFSCLEDKDIEEMLSNIKAICNDYENTIEILIPKIQDNPRAMEAEKIALAFANGRNLLAKPYKNLDECIKYLHNEAQAKEGAVLICGSLYLLAEFYTQYPSFLKG